MMKLRRLFAGLAIALLVVVARLFPDRNGDLVAVDLLLGSTPLIPLWVVVLGAFGFGALLSAILFGLFLIRSKLLRRRYRKAVADLETEVHQLRTLPISSEGLVDVDTSFSSSTGEAGRSL